MKPPTRSIRDLLTHALSFGQQPLMRADQFEREAERRGIGLRGSALSVLRSSEILLPLYSWKPDENLDSLSVQTKRPYFMKDQVGRRPVGSPFMADSDLLYSKYQLLLVCSQVIRPFVNRVIQHTPVFGGPSTQLYLSNEERKRVFTVLEEYDQLVAVLSVLETVYLPEVLEVVSLDPGQSRSDWEDIRNAFDASRALDWFGADAEWILLTAEQLILDVDQLDPNAAWRDLIRVVRPERWQALKGDALIAMDHLVAAEILLLFYEDLVEAGVAPELDRGPKYLATASDSRLKRNTSDLDSVLLAYGLSPDPSLVLVLEGQTEERIMPRVMDLLGVPGERRFIQYVEARSIDNVARNVALLLAYTLRPILGAIHDDFVEVNRPMTKVLAVVDPEKDFSTSEKRQKKHSSWTNEVFSRLPDEFQVDPIRDVISSLLFIETWGVNSFEFAHFTDKELASALLELYEYPKSLDLPSLTKCITGLRSDGKNLKIAWERWGIVGSKVELAEKLWTTLRIKMLDAISRDDYDSVPILRIATCAFQLVLSVSRRPTVIRYKPKQMS